MLGRMVDLRDVVDRRDAVVELAERAEQLVDVHVLRAVHRREREESVLIVVDVSARRAGQEQPVGEEAAECRLELVMVRIDEAGMTMRPRASITSASPACSFGRRDDLLALDQHVGLGEVAHLRILGHHGTAVNDVAPAAPACVVGRILVVCRGRTRCEEIRPAAATPVAAVAFRKSRREVGCRCGMPSSHSVHIGPLRVEAF